MTDEGQVHDSKPSRIDSMTTGGALSAIAMLHRQIAHILPELPCTLAIGKVTGALRTFEAETILRMNATAALVQVIVPIAGSVSIGSQVKTYQITPGSALLFAGRDPADSVWDPRSIGLTLQVPRKAVQARSFSAAGYPRRLASCLCDFQCSDPAHGLGAGLAALAAAWPSRLGDRDDALGEAGEALIAGLCEELMRSEQCDKVFQIVGSVRRALDRLRLKPTEVSMEDLAAAARVTLPVLKRNVRDHTGSTLGNLLLGVQLDWVHDQLRSDKEARSVTELARLTGYRTAPVFIRAYQRRFGETPTQTRGRTFGLR